MIRRSEQGMTLMELLVAMVIGSLVITLVVRGLGLTLNLYDRVVGVTSTMDVRFRESQWWADSVASLVPCTDPEHCLKGSSSSLSGYTFAPILDDAGKRTPVAWQLVEEAGQAALEYREGEAGQEAVLKMSIKVPLDARFAYLHPDGDWREEWNANGDNVRLPEAIRVEDGSEMVWIFGTPVQRPYGREDYRDMLELE